MKQRLVLIGNGMAGVRTLEELLKLDAERYAITVFGAEPHGNYNRILLSPVLSGEKRFDEIVLNDAAWYAGHGITLHAGCKVTALDRRRRVVRADDGREVGYDRLLLATGSDPVVLPLPGNDLDGVLTFRDIADVQRMLARAGEGRRAVVIGGGLLGLEAANGLRKQGMQVTVIHLLDRIMERQLDAAASACLNRALAGRGIDFALEAQTEALIGDGQRVVAVRLQDGRELPADLVVMAVGIRPNVTLARASGLHCERGIVVDDTLQTYDPRVYAVGECVQHRGQLYGLVAPLFEQAKVCANHLAELGYARYAGTLLSTKLKVTGIDLFSAGEFDAGEGSDEIVYQDPGRGVYKRLVVRDDRLVGAVLYGDTVDGAWYFQLMRDGSDISAHRDHLAFGQAHLGDAAKGGTNAALLADAAEVCGCNGVCKGTIVNAITSHGLFTLDEVRAHTKASSSCGSCTGLVEQLLASVVGEGYAPATAAKPLCPCTDHPHDAVRRAIREQRLTSVRAVLDFLEWRTPDGCAKCRPALNYYVVAAWPGTATDDPQSRFVNERNHANIQRDGSYTVVPRIWGGVTTARELRAIADAAEKFEVPLLKVTGGQRIDLVGVRKEQLPGIWADLNAAGLVSGHAYGKALRTVKTCIGAQYCRFGTQDSIGMGIRLEQLTWGSWMPHKFKMAVSGCPRNCAEATIKDFGVVAVDSGWELHVGGNGGTKVRVTDLLCKVQGEDEVVEHCTAFIQLYREEAHYLERTAPWIERVGLPYVRQCVVDDAGNRAALARRFAESQRHAQSDPWAEQVARRARGDGYQPLTVVDADGRPTTPQEIRYDRVAGDR